VNTANQKGLRKTMFLRGNHLKKRQLIHHSLKCFLGWAVKVDMGKLNMEAVEELEV
jgi:hypothetical protein